MDSHWPDVDGVRFCGGAFWPVLAGDANHSRRLSSAAPRAFTLDWNRVYCSRCGGESLVDTATSAPGWGIEPRGIRSTRSLPAGCRSGFVPGVGWRSNGDLSDLGLKPGRPHIPGVRLMKTLGPITIVTANDPKAPAEAERPRLGKAGTLARFALIGVALAAALGTFAYLGGWFTPNELTPARLTDGFEQVDGVHPGFRRNHAKGVGVAGYFESNGNGVRLSKAVVFQPGRVPVLGRFCFVGGQP